MFIFLFAPHPVVKKENEKDQKEPFNINLIIQQIGSEDFNQKVLALKEKQKTEPSELLGHIIKFSSALLGYKKEIETIKNNLIGATPSTTKKIVTGMGGSIIAAWGAIPYILSETISAKTNHVSVDYEKTRKELREVLWSGWEIGRLEKRALIQFEKAFGEWGDSIANTYTLYNKLSTALLQNDSKLISLILPEYNKAIRLMQVKYEYIEYLFEQYKSVANELEDAHILAKTFMKTAGLLLSTTLIPNPYETAVKLKQAKNLVPILKVGKTGRATDVACEMIGEYIIPAVKIRGLLFSAALVFTFDQNQVRSIFSAWMNSQDVAVINNNGKEETQIIKEGKLSKYVKIQDGFVTTNTNIIEKNGKSFLETDNETPLQIKKAGFSDFLDAMTTGVVKTTVDTIEIGFFFGNAVKFVKIGTRTMFGGSVKIVSEDGKTITVLASKMAKLSIGLGTDQKIIEVLAKQGVNIGNEEVLKVVGKLITDPKRSKEILQMLQAIDKKMTRSAAEQIEKIVKEGFEEAKKLIKEDSAGRIGSATKNFIKLAGAATGISFIISSKNAY